MRLSWPATIFVLLAGFLGFAGGFYAPNADGADYSPQLLIEKSGVGLHLDTMAVNLTNAIEHAVKGGTLALDANKISKLNAAFAQAYAPEKLRAMAAEGVAAKIKPEQGAKIIAFLETPLGVRVVAQESRLAAPDIQTEITQNAAAIVAEAGKNTVRLALYASLNQAMGSTRRAVQTYIGGALAMHAARLADNPHAPNMPSLDDVKKGLEAQSAAIAAAMSQAVLSNTAYAYKNLSEADLNAYLEFALSSEGKIYFNDLGDIFADMLLACAYDVGKLAWPQKPKPI